MLQNKDKELVFRVVLVEKVNHYLVKSIDNLTRKNDFSTEVIPLPNKHYAVFQKSEKAASKILGPSSDSILVRLIILTDILDREKSVYKISASFSIENYYRIEANRYSKEFKLFHNTTTGRKKFSYSNLLMIPASSEKEFINTCITCHFMYLNHNFNFLYEQRINNIPALIIKANFSYEAKMFGNWFKELMGKAGTNFKNDKKGKISLYNQYVMEYNMGMWNDGGIIEMNYVLNEKKH